MLNQSRGFNMLECLLAALASNSQARFHCDACSIQLFFPSSKTISLRCSFFLHVDSSRLAPQASIESRLFESRDIRSIRIAMTVPCQYHQQESLVMLLSCNCKNDCLVTMLSYCFAVPATVRLSELRYS